MALTGELVELSGLNIGSFAQLYVDVFNAPPWNDGWSPSAANERLTSFTEFPRFRGLGLVQNGEPAALVLGWGERWASGWVFHIKEMCIATALQRCGVGRKLLTIFERQLVAQDFVNVYLQTAAHAPARQFYEKCGYEVFDVLSLRKRLCA